MQYNKTRGAQSVCIPAYRWEPHENIDRNYASYLLSSHSEHLVRSAAQVISVIRCRCCLIGEPSQRRDKLHSRVFSTVSILYAAVWIARLDVYIEGKSVSMRLELHSVEAIHVSCDGCYLFWIDVEKLCYL